MKIIKIFASMLVAFGMVVLIFSLVSPTFATAKSGINIVDGDPIRCYVETNGDNNTDYSSSDASALQTAVNAASANDIIKVAGNCTGVQQSGGLTQTLFISQSLLVQGGYTHTNWLAAPDPAMYTTTLDAVRSGRVAYITGTVDVTLDGLYITGGDGGQSGGTQSGSWRNFGGAIFLESGNVLTIANGTVYSNTIIGPSDKGGALALDGTASTVITNSTFSDNYAPTNQGGAIYLDDSTNELRIYDSLFKGNASGTNQGGVIYNSRGVLEIHDSIFESNYSNTNQGGVLYSSGSSNPITITNSIFRDNWSGNNQGGALYLNGSTTIISSTFEGNSAWSNNGGAIYSYGQLDISNSHFQENQTGDETETNDGGAIYSFRSSISILDSTFISNTATGDGGAVYVVLDSVTITNSTFVSNSADNGGGLYLNDNLTSTTLKNVTLSANTAITNGGGVYNDNPLTLQNVTFFANSANSGGGLYNSGVLTYHNTLIAGSTAGGDCANYDTISSNVRNLVEDGSCSPALSGDPLLADLGDYGGETWTHALLFDSSAIEAGDNATCAETDQRGVLRPQGTTCDIGAFEAQSFTLTVTLDGTGGSVTSDPVGIDCGVDCSEIFIEQSVITLTASADADYVFTGWSGGGCSGTDSCVVTLTESLVVTAVFEPDEYLVYLPMIVKP